MDDKPPSRDELLSGYERGILSCKPRARDPFSTERADPLPVRRVRRASGEGAELVRSGGLVGL